MYGPFYTKLRNPAPRKTPAFLLNPNSDISLMLKDNLDQTIKDISTLFPLKQP